MDKEWSEKAKQINKLLGNKETFAEAVDRLIAFRAELFEQVAQILEHYPKEALSMRPFPNAEGYHCKTLSYSVWHIFRIEDIVAHSLIARDTQILFCDDYLKRTGSPIITTGNELDGEEIEAFSKALDAKELLSYARAVMESTNRILKALDYAACKTAFTSEDGERLKLTGSVSEDEKAVWLIEYWCGKDIRGLIKMPFCRHWVMHIEAMLRIKSKLCKDARKGVDPIAYCGFSCSHCFLSQRCGSCRTAYNVCSFALCAEDHICPNVSCCRSRGYDGCYECAELERCEKGFYTAGNDGANAAKAQALYIRKYGKKAFLKMQDRLHEKYAFEKTQEILGQDMYQGLKILEES